MSNPSSDFGRAGGRIGPYVVEGIIGRGGMGAVYRARHTETDARHAVKVILAARLERQQSRALARFQREAEVLARIAAHPNVVRVHASGVDRGVPWCAMEHVEGESLADRLRAGPLPPAEAARLVVALAHAIHHVHGSSVVHRDLKPENVLIDRDGVARIVDFGLAYDAFAEQLTRTGECLGTPAYMAPEQVSRDSGDSVEATAVAIDVYGLGATLYAALTGHPPFESHGRPSLALIADIVQRAPDPPSQHVPGVPADLQAVCLRALEKSPADRYPTARALARDLERWIAGEPVEARRRLAPWRRAVRTLRRRRRRVAAAGGLALVGAVAVVALTWGGAIFGAAPAERLDRLAGELRRLGRLEARDAARAEALRDAVRDDPELARRAEALHRLARLTSDRGGDEADARALAAAVRPGGRVDRTLLLEAVSILHRARRLDAVDHVLHGAEPVEPAPLEVAGDLARAMATSLAPPSDDAAFGVLMRAPVAEEVKGLLLRRRADALAASGEADRLAKALDGYAEALRSYGLTPERSAWSGPIVRFAPQELLRLARERDPRARQLADVIVRAGGGDDPLEPKLVADLQNLAGAFATGGQLSEAQAELILLVGPFLSVHGCWPIHEDKLTGVYDALGSARFARLLQEELARPPERSNPGVLLFLALLLDQTDRREDTPRLVEKALQSGVTGAWIYGLVGRYYRTRDDYAMALEYYDQGLQLDRRRPMESRQPALCDRTSQALLRAARSRGGPGPEEARRAAALMVEGVEVQKAVLPRLEEMARHGALAPWPLHRGKGLAQRIPEAVAQLLEVGAPHCCGEGEGIRSPSIERLVELGLFVESTNMGTLAVGLDAGMEIPPEAELILFRGSHHERHGRLEPALADLDEAIRRVRASGPWPDRDLERKRLLRLAGALGARAQLLRRLGQTSRAAQDEAEASEVRGRTP